MRRHRIAVCCAVCVILGGCGTDPALTPQDVRGEITLDGKPLHDGKAYLVPSNGDAPVSAEVVAGAFHLRTVPGSYRVEVRSFKPRVPWPGEPHDKMINFLPPRYNTESELKAEVKAGTPNEFTFALKAR